MKLLQSTYYYETHTIEENRKEGRRKKKENWNIGYKHFC